MKKLALLMLISFFACNSDKQAPEPITFWGDVAWEGYVDEDEQLLTMFEEVAECVGDAAINQTIPYMVIVTGWLFHPSAPNGAAGFCDLYNERIYAVEGKYKTYRHEFVHWLTGLGEVPLVDECSYY